MERTEDMRLWLQAFLDENGGGKIWIDRQDGIPGNCCLTYRGTKEISRKRDIAGIGIAKKRSRYYLTRLCTGPEGQGWFDMLESWANSQLAEGVGPFQERSMAAVTLQGQQLVEVRPDGTYLYGAHLQAEYETRRAEGAEVELFTLDGESYGVDVMALEREFEIREALPGCITLDGTYHRELLGTYYHYTLTVCCRQDRQELERFWEKVSQPNVCILCSFPYGDGFLTQEMFVESGIQALPDTRGENRWDKVTVRFRGKTPQVMA